MTWIWMKCNRSHWKLSELKCPKTSSQISTTLSNRYHPSRPLLVTKNLNRPQATNRLESHHCDLFYDCRFFALLGSHPTWKLLETRLINCEHDHKERKTGWGSHPQASDHFRTTVLIEEKKRKINAFYVPETMMIPPWWCWEMREKSTDQPPPTAAVTLYLKWGVLWTNKNQHFTNKAYPDREAVQYKYDRKFWSSSLNMKWDAWLLTLMSAVRAIFPWQIGCLESLCFLAFNWL